MGPANFEEPHPNFAGNSRSNGISQLQAGKTLSKRARSHFLPKGVCSPMYFSIFTFYGPPQYLSWFSSWRPKRRKFQFFTNLHVRPHANFFWWPAAASILIPPTFHIACLNHYTPKFSGVAQKLTWSQ